MPAAYEILQNAMKFTIADEILLRKIRYDKRVSFGELFYIISTIIVYYYC